MIRLTFRANGYNWEKYLRWINRIYFERFGRFYRPLVETIFRYNNKQRFDWYLHRPELLTDELYRDYRDGCLPGNSSWTASMERAGGGLKTPHGLRGLFRRADGNAAAGCEMKVATSPQD